ncbi:MAG: homocysteine S-methyltransferase family protein [Chloroflexota bacterium]|nr:homocysteine S-methyltransferase family protein [Chloroflexota bacterium]
MSKDILTRLAAGDVLITDGATGTNLQEKGLPVGASAELWVLENPDAIQSLNRAFIEAGADLILTCTFGGTRTRLAASGMADRFEAVNRKAVALTQEVAAGTDVLVAGSIGPTGQMLAPLGTLTVEAAEADFTAQAQVLIESGVDLIVIETQFDLNEASATVRGVRSVDREIPLVCSFSYDRGTRTMMGIGPEAMAEAISALDVDVLGINCGRSLDENAQALAQLRPATDKPIWFKPNAGLPEVDEDGKPAYSVTPKKMGSLAPEWVATGAQLVGGCCGTSPAHLAEIARAIKG